MNPAPTVRKIALGVALLCSVCLPPAAQAADVDISDARVTTQVLNTLAPGGTTADITSTGSVIVDNAAGNAVTAAGQSWTITNAGTIRNSDSTNNANARGLNCAAGCNVTNTGTIATGSTAAAALRAITAGTLTLDNQGTITGGTGVLSTSRPANITNSGAITGTGSNAINATGAQFELANTATGQINAANTAVLVNTGANHLTVTNHGDIISTNGRGVDGIALGAGTISIHNYADGEINARQVPINLYGGNRLTNSVINDGLLVSANNEGILYDSAGSGGLYIENNGTIDAAVNGIRIANSAAAFSTVVNNGTIIAHATTGANGNAMGLNSGGSLTNGATGLLQSRRGMTISGGTLANNFLINHGTIESTDQAFRVTGTESHVENTGIVTTGLQGLLATGLAHVVNSGSITSGTAVLNMQAGGTVANNGGTLSGTIGINASTSAVAVQITNTGTITGSDGTAITLGSGDDSVLLQTGSVVNGAILGGLGADTFTLDGNGTLDSDVSGFENFTINADATGWNTTGTLDFTGADIDHASGRFYLNGDLTANRLDVASAATLLGGGTLTGNLFIGSGGAIAPGNSIGTLTVTGDFTHDANATYHVEVDNALNSDLIDVSGVANLGGHVSVTAAPGHYGPTNVYTILTAGGGLNGTFADAQSLSSFLDADLNYDANNVYLTLSRNTVQFADLAGNLGAAFDAVPDSDPAKQLLIASPDAVVVASLQNAAAVPYPSESAGIAQAVEKINTIIGNRMTMLRAASDTADAGKTSFSQIEPAAGGFSFNDAFRRDGGADRMTLGQFGALWPAPANNWGAWVQGYGVTGRTKQGGSKLDYDYAGIAAGMDYQLSSELLAGATLGYARGFSDFALGNGEATTDMYQLAGYFAYTEGAWTVQGMGGYSFATTDAERRILFGGLPLQLYADYDTHIWHASAEAGRSFEASPAGRAVTLTPLLGAAYSRQEQDAFTERGSGAGISVLKNNTQSIKPSVGLRAETQIEKADGSRITPALTARLRHELGDDTADVNGRFAGAGGIGPAFALRGIERARTEANIEAGVRYDTPDNTSYFASYGTTQSATTAEHELLMGVKINF